MSRHGTAPGRLDGRSRAGGALHSKVQDKAAASWLQDKLAAKPQQDRSKDAAKRGQRS
jgi:hypothetical protein